MMLRVFLVATVLLAAACSNDNSDKPLDTSTLTIAIGASPQSLDPHVVTGVPGIHIVSNLGEPLVRLNLDSLAVEPAAAESWQISDDGLRYTFTLRQNARWSNGEPVTAKDFVYAWQRGMMPTVGWQYAVDYYVISGAKAIHTGENSDLNSLGVTALDDYRLQFTLNHPHATFLKDLSSSSTIPLHQTSLEQHGAMDDVTSDWTRAGNYVSNGPFFLQQWDINKIIVLKKNPHYWDADAIKLETVEAYPLETEAAEERAFRAGQIQLGYGGRIPVSKIATYKREAPNNLRIVHSFATYFYLFNVTQPPFDNVKVRQALSHAIDREAIVKNITKAGEGVATTLSPPAAAHFDQIEKLAYNPAKARQLLAEAGYPNGEGFPASALIYNTSDLHRKVALAIQQMWKQTLGVDITLENQEWKVFLNTRQNLNYAIARAGSVSSTGDAQSFLDSYQTGHGMNDTGWANSEYDALVNRAAQTLDKNQRLALLAQAENILLQQAPLAPLYYYANSFLIADEVKNFRFNALSRLQLKGVYIESNETAQ